MAYQHFETDETLKPARDEMDVLRNLRAAWDAYRNMVNCQNFQKDSDNDFTSIAANYGYKGADDAAKKANAGGSNAEFNAALGAADAAITQMLNKHLTR